MEQEILKTSYTQQEIMRKGVLHLEVGDEGNGQAKKWGVP